MTSFTAGETKADTANLFTLPNDQIAHLQIAPVAKGSLAASIAAYRFGGL